MRTEQEINQEFANLCAQIGQLEVAKTEFLSMTDAQLAPLHDKVGKLKAEMAQVKAVAEELAKQKEAADGAAATSESTAS